MWQWFVKSVIQWLGWELIKLYLKKAWLWLKNKFGKNVEQEEELVEQKIKETKSRMGE